MTIRIDLRPLIRPRRNGKRRRPDALVMREPLPFAAQIEQRAFWWKFSTDRLELLADQLDREATRAAVARRLALEPLNTPAESARMDAVHESRASRRAERKAD